MIFELRRHSDVVDVTSPSEVCYEVTREKCMETFCVRRNATVLFGLLFWTDGYHLFLLKFMGGW